VTDQGRYSQSRPASFGAQQSRSSRPTYLGIIGLLLLLVIVLTGGIIWYNTKKSSELAIAATDRLMQEVGDDVLNRIKLLYDPIYAIVGIGSLVPELTTPAVAEDPRALSLILRVLRIYPQMLSLYVGFDNGDFFMVNIAEDNGASLREALHAPQPAAFANEIISADTGGDRKKRWVFLAEDGAVIGRTDPVPADFDPRQRPWYDATQRSEAVEQSDLYIFAAAGSLVLPLAAALPDRSRE
jgi:adenylate cyclase